MLVKILNGLFFLLVVLSGSLSSICVRAQTMLSSTSSPDMNESKLKMSVGLVEVDQSLQVSRLSALNNIKYLNSVLEIRIRQAVDGEILSRQSLARVRAGVGRGVDLELSKAYWLEADISWRNAYLDRHHAIHDFRSIYGDLSARDLDFDVSVNISEREFIELTGSSERLVANHSWARYRIAHELALRNADRLLSIKKVRDAYKDQFAIGQRVLLDLVGVYREFSDAEIGLAQAEARYRLYKINILAQSGSFGHGGLNYFGGNSFYNLDDEVASIEGRIAEAVQQNMVSYFYPDLRLNYFALRQGGSGISFSSGPFGVPTRFDSDLSKAKYPRGRWIFSVRGKAMLRYVNGDLAWLGFGDYVPPSAEVILWPGSEVVYRSLPDRILAENETDISSAQEEIASTGLYGGDDGGVRRKLVDDGLSCNLPQSGEFILPRFQWPPWSPTGEHGIDFGARKNFGEIADYLSKALDRVGYENHYSYATLSGLSGLSIGGFAIVSDPEQILPDGRAVAPSGRWQSRS